MQSSILQQCPSCARIVTFSLPETTILQCVCGTIINRKDGGILLAKPFSPVPDPGDLIQPGTGGKWQERTFTVLGRFRAWFEVSVFNYWTILFSDGELAYLGEGYGLYAIMRKTTIDRLLTASNLAGITVGIQRTLLNEREFLMEKRSGCSRWEIEGEVWLPECNSNFTIYDFAASNGQRITLFQFLPDLIVPFDVTYVSHTTLQLTNTRSASLQVIGFSCAHCRNNIEVKTFPFAQSCACMNCGLQYTLKKGEFASTGKLPSVSTGADIKLGSRGMIQGVRYEVIGYVLKEEKNEYHSRWKEYTLYNREEGYAFLSEYEGNWIYVRERGDAPVPASDRVSSFEYGKQEFTLFNAYSFSVVNARGEFSNNLFQDNSTYCKEFVSPPSMWIMEQNKQEGICWFSGEHVSGKDLEKKIDMPAGAPYKSGIGAIEPKSGGTPSLVVAMGGLGVLFLLILHLFLSVLSENRVVLDQDFVYSTDTVGNEPQTGFSFVSKPFRLDKWRSNLAFDMSAPVDNDWFELNITLVNKATGAEYGLEQGVEYYHGISDSESWEEGSRYESAWLTSIPSGEYILQIQALRSPANNHVNTFHVKAVYDVPMGRNLLISILLLLIWPVVQYFRTNNIEKERWYNSPYSPYHYEN